MKIKDAALNALGRVLLAIDDTIDGMIEAGAGRHAFHTAEDRRAERLAILSRPVEDGDR